MLEITIILTVISAATCGIFLAKGFHGCLTVSSLLTTILAECLACMVITENSCLWVIYTCVAMFFYYQTIKSWEAYKSRKPNRVYKDYKEIPQGVYYIRTQQGTFKTIPQALQNYAVDLTKAFAYEYKTRRDIAVMRIKTLKEEGKWSNYDYWKSQGKCMWNVQDSLKRVAEATDEQLDIRAKEDAQALVKDLHHRIKSYIGATEDYSGLEVTTGTQGYAVINGFLTGTAGKCEVRSIECGGYNIVCWHIRVIVVRAK